MYMTVVLCDSFDQAQSAFSIFMDFLEKFDCFLIDKVYESSYCVETVENIRYIFIDYRFENILRKHGATDIVNADEFLEGVSYFVEDMEEL